MKEALSRSIVKYLESSVIGKSGPPPFRPLTRADFDAAVKQIEQERPAPLHPHHPRCVAVLTDQLGDCTCATMFYDYGCAVAVLDRLAEIDDMPRPHGVAAGVTFTPREEDGWRQWAAVLAAPYMKEALLRAVLAAQKVYGVENVATAAPRVIWKDRSVGLTTARSLVGVYVRSPWRGALRGLYLLPTQPRSRVA